MKKITKYIGGFTMIEVMAGMVLITVGLLMLMPMMMVSMRGNNIARGSTEASMLIKDKMEELKNSANPVSGVDSLDNQVCIWTVTSPETNLRRIQVRVDWNDKNGLTHSNSMITYTTVE